jgi:histidyl-tRNA synthetase
MLRPGWFPEYSPKQQQIFDQVYSIIASTFAQHGYQHIQTPAVEKIDVLSKGWDEVSKQIFGLVWLEPLKEKLTEIKNRIWGLYKIDIAKDWLGESPVPESSSIYYESAGKEVESIIKKEVLKDYALHFDLTVPFARYVLDWQNEIAFPFKRYQIQPVRRGERSQKGRFKEFRQADIDIIWKDEDNKDYNNIYDAEVMTTLIHAMRVMLDTIGLEEKKLVVRYNNKKFIQDLAKEYNVENNITQILGILDKYYKLSNKDFISQLEQISSKKFVEKIENLIGTSPVDNNIQQIKTKVSHLEKKFWVHKIEFVFDPSIVRGLDYYTGTVFETFVDNHVGLGSICSGGSYANFTDFLDSKQSLSGVWGSIGLSRLMSLLFDEFNLEQHFQSDIQSYLIINTPDTQSQAQQVLTKLHDQNKIAEIYPTPDKIDKQFKYADKKGISHVIQIFTDTNSIKYKKIPDGNWQDIDI